MRRFPNLEQCEKIPGTRIPQIEQEYDGTPLEAAERLVDKMPMPPKIEHNGVEACYRPKCDTVDLPPRKRFRSAESYYGTLFHELIHSTGHPLRLSRFSAKMPTAFGSESYSKEELVAEVGAAFLCGGIGLDNRTLRTSAAYIEGWMKRLREDERLLVQAAAKAQKAADYILRRETKAELLFVA